jgi:proteasome lid subunit RPN8/RPN11
MQNIFTTGTYGWYDSHPQGDLWVSPDDMGVIKPCA